MNVTKNITISWILVAYETTLAIQITLFAGYQKEGPY